MKHEMTMKYLKCKAYFCFEIYFKLNGTHVTIEPKWDAISFEKEIVFIQNIFFLFEYDQYVHSCTRDSCAF